MAKKTSRKKTTGQARSKPRAKAKKTQVSKAGAPKAEALNSEAPKAEASNTEASNTEASNTEASKAEAPVSKSGFIRSMPTAPAAEIIRLYKEQYGEKINASLIYNVRNNVRKKAEKAEAENAQAENAEAGGTQNAETTGSMAGSPSALTTSDIPKRRNVGLAPLDLTDVSIDPQVVTQFRSAVLRLGLDRAEALLEHLRSSLDVYMGATSPRQGAPHAVALNAGARSLQLEG